MGFWDEYTEIGGNWIKADEKQVLIENGIPLDVIAVLDDPTNQYGPRYVMKVNAPNPETGEYEERAIGFPQGTVESRDRMLAQLTEYLARPDADDVAIKLEKVGRSILIRQA